VELDMGLPDDRREAVEDRVRDRLERIDAPTVLVGGTKLAERAFAEQSVHDLAIGESVAFAVLLVALVVIFGGPVAAGVPLVVAVTAVAGTLLALLALSTLTRISEYSLNVVTLLGLGLAVDYSLLIVARFREEERDLARTMAGAGRAVCVSGIAVAAALAGLATFAEPLLAAVALGGAAVVVLTTLAALTLVPALLALVGGRIPLTPARRLRIGRRTGPPFLARLTRYSQQHSGGVALAATAGLLLLALPLLGANFADSDARALPTSNEARQAYDAYRAKFANNAADPVVIVVAADPGRPDVRQFMNQVNRLPQAFRMDVRHDVASGWTVLDVTPRGEPEGRQSGELVNAVRAMPTPFAKQVAGATAEAADYRASLVSRLPAAAAIVLLTTVVLLFALTRSLVVPVKAVILNLLTLGASLGVLIVVFQWGWGGVPLRFDPWGGVDLTTPVLLFVFIFGLSMDYEVFLLARIKEERDKGADNDRAVLAGITASGPVVTAAALCICIVFLGFAAGGLTAVKEIGVGMTVAVVLDVTVVRGLLLPAVMTLLGELNWWAPGRRHQGGAAKYKNTRIHRQSS
jgi:RND superfamily putative drug exporter